MNRRSLVLLFPPLLLASACFASIPTDFFLLDCAHGYYRVEGGKLVLGPRSGRETQKAPDHWHVLGTQIKSSVGGGYLAYDPSGKDDQVGLAARPGENTEWTISKSGGEREVAVVKAAKGPFKGWSLHVEKGRLVLREKPSNPVTVARIYRSN